MTTTVPTSPDAALYSFQFHELAVDPKDIFSILGYAPQKAPGYVRAELDDVLQAAGDYCDIRTGARLFNDIQLTKDKKHIVLQDVNFAVGKIIARRLHGADSAVLFACSIGPGLEKWSRELMARGDFLKGYIVDAVASVAVEAAADKIHTHASELAAGKKSSNRYSPGYCGWDVAEQHKLFSLLPHNFCGITLAPSSMMTPIKSVSGLIGLGPNMQKVDYTCRLCDMKDCVYRRRQKIVMQE